MGTTDAGGAECWALRYGGSWRRRSSSCDGVRRVRGCEDRRLHGGVAASGSASYSSEAALAALAAFAAWQVARDGDRGGAGVSLGVALHLTVVACACRVRN